MNELYDHIEYVICAGEDVSPEELQTGTRKAEVLFARQLIMYFADEFKIGSYAMITERYGQDHATLNNTKKVINNYIDTDKFKRGKIAYYRGVLCGVQKVSRKIDALLLMFNILDKELAGLEQRYLNLQVLVENLKIELIELK